MALTRVTGSVKIDRDFATTAAMTAAKAVRAGDVVSTKEFSTGNGGGGTYDVISGTGTANGRNIIAHDTESLSFVLREEGQIIASQWGLNNSNTAANNTTILQAIADYVETNKIDVVLPSQTGINFNGPITFTSPSFDWTFEVRGYGLKYTELVNQSTGGEHGFVVTGTSGTESVWSTFRDFKITGNASSGNGVNIDLAGRVEFSEFESSDNGGHGIYYNNAWAISLIRCRADRNANCGVYLLGGANNKINGAYIEGGAYSSNTEDGIYLEAATDDDTISGTIINVGLSNNDRNGIWCKTPGVRILGCFPEFNKGAQIKIGDAADARVIQGVDLQGNFIDSNNTGGANYDSIIIEEARGVTIEHNNFKNTTSAVDIDSSSTNITVRHNRKAGSVTNIMDVNGTLFTDATVPYIVRANPVLVQTAPIQSVEIESGTSGLRVDVSNNGAGGSSTLYRLQKDGSTVFGVRNDGKLLLSGSTAATTPGSVTDKLEVYDEAGASIGFIAIYDAIT